MNSEEYKNIINSKNVLDHSTLDITLKEVIAAKKNDLPVQIERILKENKIEKPTLHSRPDNQTTDYFKVDLKSEDIDEIADLFYDLEVQHIGKNGETTPACAFYATLADKWATLNS